MHLYESSVIHGLHDSADKQLHQSAPCCVLGWDAADADKNAYIKLLITLSAQQVSLPFAADADKKAYAKYYELCLQLVRKGGIIILDNVLWYGRVADPQVSSPVHTNNCSSHCGTSSKTPCKLSQI